MSKIAFSDKCHVLGELWLYYRDESVKHEEWSQFFAWADIALPLSYMLWQGLAESPDTEDGSHGRDLIDQTWDTFCKMIDIDPNVKYDNINVAWAASPNSLYISEDANEG